jgi:hypothetical protein
MLALAACRKDDKSVFDQPADARINQALSQYQQALTAAPNGWEARITTGTGSIFNFHFKFNDANRVVTYADIDTITASTPRESSYRLKALQQPSLIFDTYTYLHMLADPDGAVNGGDYGSGLQSDFEFAIDTVTADSIRLTGRFNKTAVTLYKATPEQEAAWQNGAWRRTLDFQYLGSILQYFKRLSWGSNAYDISINNDQHTITFIWVDSGGNLHRITAPFYYTSQGLFLPTPFTNGGVTISSITSTGWNPNTRTLSIKINGGTSGTIAGAASPAQVDLDAPRRWWDYAAQQQDGYWISVNGFHVNGVDDAYHVRSIPNFYFMLFWPAYGRQSNITYDLQGYVTVQGNSLSLDFGAATLPPTFTADGRIIFRLFGTLGDVPPEAAGAFANTNTQMTEARGFYLVQTSATTYDMVSAKDALAWITWEY